MNRHAYQKLRHAARLAQRAWWKATKDPYSTQYDRDRARHAMHDEASKVPGGMGRSSNEVMLDGWFWRRAAVGKQITDRKAKARIADAIELMAERFAPMEWRKAA